MRRMARARIKASPPICTDAAIARDMAAPRNPNLGTSSQLAAPQLAATTQNNGTCNECKIRKGED